MTQASLTKTKSVTFKKKRITQKTIAPYIFVLPFIVSFTVFFVYPMIDSVIMSFHGFAGFGQRVFVGFDNYRALNNMHYMAAISNSLRYTFWTILVLIPLPLLVAVMLNSKIAKGKNFFRSVLFMPALTSVIVAGMFFRLAFGTQPEAFANAIVGVFGVEPVRWLMGPATGMFALVILATWRWFGVNIVYFLAGLQSIPNELYEAAEIDGANSLKKFLNITLPGLAPIAIYVTTISIFGGLSMFVESFVYWGIRSPANIGLTLVGYLYSSGIASNDFGLASAVGITLVLMIMAVTILQFSLIRFLRRGDI